MRIIGDHFRRYAHALRFAIGLHGAKKFHPIVKNKHYQISSGARASLAFWCIFRSDFVFKKFQKLLFLYKNYINYRFFNKNFKNYYFLYKK